MSKEFKFTEKDYDWYPNQRTLVINRDTVESGTQRRYLIAYTDNLLRAMSELSPSAFKVYLYLLMNKDNYKLEYSPAHIGKMVNVCKDTARDAFQRMERLGYFDRLDDNEHKFNFYEVPRKNSYIRNQQLRCDTSDLETILNSQ